MQPGVLDTRWALALHFSPPPSIGKRGGDITPKGPSARTATSTPDYAGHDSASQNYTVTGPVRHPLSQWDDLRARARKIVIFVLHISPICSAKVSNAYTT